MRLSRIWRILQIKEGVIHREPKAKVDNTLRDLQNSSYPTKAEVNNCFIIHSKYYLILKGVSPFRSLFFHSPNITQPCLQVFAVSGSIICSGLHFWRHFDVNGWRQWFNNFRRAPLLTSLIQYGEFGERQLVMVNYAFGFNQSETGKYFEWMIISLISPIVGIFLTCQILYPSLFWLEWTSILLLKSVYCNWYHRINIYLFPLSLFSL